MDQHLTSFAQLSKLLLNDMSLSNNKSAISSKFTKENIIMYLQNPQKSQKELRRVSRFLYNTSPNYKRLVQYFATMLRFDYIIKPFDLNIDNFKEKPFKDQYSNILKLIETMNLQHEFTKLLLIAFKEDVFYGYEHTTSDSYFIQKLDPDYCRISSIEDGVFNYSFDFAYFDSNKDILKDYPKEFRVKYLKYTKDKTGLRWQELNSENTICIKVNEELEYLLPPFSSVFESVLDIDETKRLRNVKNKMDNYMILTQKIPMDEKSGEADKLLLNMETAIDFHNMAMNALPEEVGLVTSPMQIEAIKLERKSNDADAVAKAERDYYNAAGVSQILFNSDGMSGKGLSKSIITDEQVAFRVLKQLERWLNRKLKKMDSEYKFRIELLETTKLNVETVRDSLLQAAQYGMPVKSALASTLGVTQSNLNNMAFLENEIMNLPDNLIPLSSSHTQSVKSAGAPKKKEDALSDKGVETRENEGNLNRE
ncbi:hypothetical protein P9D26_20335 [Bacillus velezensis]|uniref:hypothetical protein n=1 Tax=Bacillus velezensis TaxID=492670 RepID=UPI002DBA9C96|nr:hypothetical protein [Bacillus velezensis]MEC1395646.1 hypothetical protein [Bacillus velezensis]